MDKTRGMEFQMPPDMFVLEAATTKEGGRVKAAGCRNDDFGCIGTRGGGLRETFHTNRRPIACDDSRHLGVVQESHTVRLGVPEPNVAVRRLVALVCVAETGLSVVGKPAGVGGTFHGGKAELSIKLKKAG